MEHVNKSKLEGQEKCRQLVCFMHTSSNLEKRLVRDQVHMSKGEKPMKATVTRFLDLTKMVFGSRSNFGFQRHSLRKEMKLLLEANSVNSYDFKTDMGSRLDSESLIHKSLIVFLDLQVIT